LRFAGFETFRHQFAGFGHLIADIGAHNPFFFDAQDLLGPSIDEGNQAVFIGGNDTMIAELKNLIIDLILHGDRIGFASV
jgi:hypothetical protein